VAALEIAVVEWQSRHVALGHSNEHGLAITNVLLQVVIGAIAVFAGYAAAR